MRLTHLLLEDFRSYQRAELHPAPGLTIVTGPNAAGKSNLLESVFVAVTGRTPRAASEDELVRHGRPFARVRLDVADPTGGQGTRVELVIPGPGSTDTRRRLLVNGAARRSSSLAETVRAVLFRPEEMLLLVGAPSERRRFLDTILAQRERRLSHQLGELARVLAQRNALLRAIRAEEAGPAELAFWDEQLVEAGSRVLHARLRLVADLNRLVGPLHARVASGRAGRGTRAEVHLEYADSLKRGPFVGTLLSASELAAFFRDRLEEVRQKEIWNGMSLVGPQRDDVRAVLDGRDVATHASRGQQRTIILALKLAETDILGEGATGTPIVLLDDVFSELDVQRTARALALLVERGQVLVTTAELRHLPAEQRRGVPIWHVQDGRLSDAPLVA
ncbi:MAG: DNA replication/repair protein RecF [Candidatus Limnocylindria bacterium]